MLRVLYSFPGRLGSAGMGTTAWHQAAGAIGLGAEVTIVCGSCERRLPGKHRLMELMKIAGVKVPYRLLGRGRACRLHDRRVARLLRERHPQYDILHCWPSGSLLSLKICSTMGVASLLERPSCHTRFAYEVVGKEHAKWGLAIEKGNCHAFDPKQLAREEAEFSLADGLLCPSAFVAQTFLDLGYPPKKILRHQYGCDLGTFYADGQERRNEGLTVVFAGRCEPAKGLHYALQAWHDSGAAQRGRFIICGTYMSGYRRVVRDWLSHGSVEERGYVADIASVLRRADVLILPSIQEGSALVTYEARASGCVLVVSEASGAVCTHMVDSLVHACGDVSTLTEHLRLLSTDRTLLERLRSASLASVSDLTWQRAGQRLLDVYREVLAKVAT